MPEIAVKIEGLTYTYPDGNRALEGVNLEVKKGERWAVLGPNGAGKSTLLHLIAGLKRPASGSVEVPGRGIEGKRRKGNIPGVGILFQDPDDQLIMPTVEEDVAFGPLNIGLSADEVEKRVEWALKQTEMWEYRKRVPHHLSIGEKKRAAIAGVLAMKPDVLLLDEPTANLDPLARERLLNLLSTLEITLIIATHDQSAAIALTGKAVLLNRRVIGSGDYSALLSSPELMERAGILPPDIPALFLKLRKMGMWEQDIPLDVEEAGRALKRVLKAR